MDTEILKIDTYKIGNIYVYMSVLYNLFYNLCVYVYFSFMYVKMCVPGNPYRLKKRCFRPTLLVTEF